jgi:dipeptidase E
MKLVLYSGGATAANRRLHAALSDLCGARKRMSITYIPSTVDGGLHYFKLFRRRYKPFGFTDCRYFPVDRPFTPDYLRLVLDSDAIYLAGGNTFYFLHHLRRQNLLRRLHAFAARGGVLAGLSAGAIILTPSIGLAGYPPPDHDDNDVGLKDLTALNLVPFEFFPHYRTDAAIRRALTEYSMRCGNPIVAAADGGGVVVQGSRMTFVGKAELFLAGAHGRLNI